MGIVHSVSFPSRMVSLVLCFIISIFLMFVILYDFLGIYWVVEAGLESYF